MRHVAHLLITNLPSSYNYSGLKKRRYENWENCQKSIRVKQRLEWNHTFHKSTTSFSFYVRAGRKSDEADVNLLLNEPQSPELKSCLQLCVSNFKLQLSRLCLFCPTFLCSLLLADGCPFLSPVLSQDFSCFLFTCFSFPLLPIAYSRVDRSIVGVFSLII